MIEEGTVVKDVCAHFEEVWAKARVVGAPEIAIMMQKDAEKKEKRRLKAERSQSSELTLDDSESSSEPPAPKTQQKKRAPPVPPAWAREEGSSVPGAGPEVPPNVSPKRSGNKKGAAKPKVELDGNQGVD